LKINEEEEEEEEEFYAPPADWTLPGISPPEMVTAGASRS